MTLDTVMVTATRAERPVSAIPGSVMVIERAEIERELAISSDPTNLLEKLIPGFSVGNQTISGASETFRGRSVLVLVDGVPRNTPLRDVARIIGLIDLNNVERIEVVNGSSSLYGSGATGGTINFITKNATPGAPRFDVFTALRAFPANVGKSIAPEGSIGVSGDAGLFDYSVVLTGRMTRASYDGSGNQMPSDPLIGQGGGDYFRDFNGLAKIGRNFDDQRIELSVEAAYATQNPKYVTDYTTDPASIDFSQPYRGKSVKEDDQFVTLRYEHNDFVLGSLEVRGYYNNINKRFAFAELSPANPIVYYSGDPSDPISLDGQTELQAERAGVSIAVDTPLDFVTDTLRATWGLDYVYDETAQVYLDGVDAIAPMSQNSVGVFALLEVSPLSWLTLRGGLRFDYFNLTVEDFVRPEHYYPLYPGGVIPATSVIGGDFTYHDTTFNAGVVVGLTEEIETFFGFSQGFELPDVGAFTRRAGLAYPAPPVVDYSDIGPQAQIVNNYELGLRGNWADVRTSLSGYISTSDQGVNFNPTTNTMSQEKEIIYGVEFVGEWDATEALTLGTVLSYREGRRDTDDDGEYDAWLPNNRISTPFRATAYADYWFDFGLNLRGELEYFSGREKDDGSTTAEIESAWTVNLLASYELFGGVASLAVENLFDVSYENPTATATRNLPVAGYGTLVSMSYRISF